MSIYCTRHGEGSLMCNGTIYDVHEDKINYHDNLFWVYLGVYVGLVLFAGECADGACNMWAIWWEVQVLDHVKNSTPISLWELCQNPIVLERENVKIITHPRLAFWSFLVLKRLDFDKVLTEKCQRGYYSLHDPKCLQKTWCERTSSTNWAVLHVLSWEWTGSLLIAL